MISLHIEAENEKDFATQLTAVAALLNAQLNTVASATPPKPARGKTQTTGAAPDPGAGAEGGKSADPTGGAPGAESGGSSDGASVTRDEVAKKCTQYGQPTKGGPAALKELFLEFGSVNGKWSEIGDDQLPALNARLDELLA